MEIIEDKLQGFTQIVMMEATKKKDSILKEAEVEKQRLIEEKEIEFLQKAYYKIQDTVRKANRQSNHKVSTAVVESKKQLFIRRTEIMNSVFDKVEERLRDFRQDDKYRDFLKVKIIEGLKEVGEKDVDVLVEKQDMKLAEDIRKELGKDFEILEAENELKGGCILHSHETNRLSDRSVQALIKEQRDGFLEMTNICII